MNEQLALKQHELERTSKQLADSRFNKKLLKLQERGREGDGHVANFFIEYAVTRVHKALLQWMQQTETSSKTGRPSNASRLLPIYQAMAEHDRLEFIASALGSMFNGIGRGVSYNSCTIEIGKRAEYILMMRQARREDDVLYQKLKHAVLAKNEERKRNDALKFKARVENFEWESWGAVIHATLGIHIVELILQVTDYFTVENLFNKKKTDKRILMTPKMRREFNSNLLKDLSAQYVNMPMVVEPAPWVNGELYSGGYLSKYSTNLSMAKVASKAHKRMLREADMPLVTQALNNAQNTPWRIRKSILSVIEQQLAQKNDMGVLVRLSDYPIPPDLPVFTMARAKDLYKQYDNQTHISDWLLTLNPNDRETVSLYLDNRKKKGNAHRANVELQGQWVTTTRTLTTAKRYSVYDAIYFPYQLDFRGRLYAVTQGDLCPQGADFSKGLLEFAEGKRLGRKGYEWLSFHTANVWGDDKLTISARKEWVNSRLEWMFQMARDPFTNRDWTDADKPYQFLACCMEFEEAHRLENPYDYESRMPVALDGSCSGLQHLGMASRCPATAKAVNLVDAELPNDIYKDVAYLAHGWLVDIVEGNYDRIPEDKQQAWTKAASKWLQWTDVMSDGKLSRKVAKRAVMTYPYGSAEYGFRDQILDDFLKPYAATHELNETTHLSLFPTFEELSDAAALMAHLLYRGVTQVVQIPAQLMEWMQQMSSLIARSQRYTFRSDAVNAFMVSELTGEAPQFRDTGVKWSTPLGYPVYQSYVKPRTRAIDCAFFGKRIQMRINVQPDKDTMPQLVSPHKQKNGISPNVVHSLDATHLMLTTNALMKQVGVDGKTINAIALIHDSFGTHAANTDILWKTVRETMFKMYSRDFFGELEATFKAQIDAKFHDKIPPLPTYGNFELSSILTASYAFA